MQRLSNQIKSNNVDILNCAQKYSTLKNKTNFSADKTKLEQAALLYKSNFVNTTLVFKQLCVAVSKCIKNDKK
jgi:hypothetical protein